jgi:diguanylate cyclase (GGDEF)-like protein
LNSAITDRTRLPGVWRVPSTFGVTTKADQTLLVMLEPLRAPSTALIGVFELSPLLKDFFTDVAPHQHPVQLLDGTTALFRSAGWKDAADGPPVILEHPIALDAARWILQMQPGSTRVAQTLSWFNVLLIVLSAVAGLGVTALVWILAARTWILQRVVARRTSTLRRTLERVRQMAVTDELTGLYNRRFFVNRWEWECERARRYQRPLACLMVDVNGFKQVNDHLGHRAGDLMLQRVAQELKTALRQSDILARFGGDEFIIALPETTPAQAASVAEKLRQVTIHLSEAAARGLPPVSLSVGMSRIEGPDDSPQAILDAADQSLYAFKRRLKAAAHP